MEIPQLEIPSLYWDGTQTVGFFLKFRELSKIFSWDLCIAEITFMVRILSWNFARVLKTLLWAHVQSFSLKFAPNIWLLELYIFARLFGRARKTLVIFGFKSIKDPSMDITFFNWYIVNAYVICYTVYSRITCARYSITLICCGCTVCLEIVQETSTQSIK